MSISASPGTTPRSPQGLPGLDPCDGQVGCGAEGLWGCRGPAQHRAELAAPVALGAELRASRSHGEGPLRDQGCADSVLSEAEGVTSGLDGRWSLLKILSSREWVTLGIVLFTTQSWAITFVSGKAQLVRPVYIHLLNQLHQV